MRVVSLRFPDFVWDLIGREAAQAGVSRSQFIRETALARCYYAIGRRAEPVHEEKYRDMWAAARAALEAEMQITGEQITGESDEGSG